MKARSMKAKEQEQRIITAVDFGSSALRAMSATQNADGTFHILGVEEISKCGYMKNGIITNSTDASMKLGRILHLLKNRIGCKEDIQSAFFSLGGRLLQEKIVPVLRNFPSKTYITQSLLDDMQKESMDKIAKKCPGMTGINSEAVRYTLDEVMQTEVPVQTQKAQHIVVEYSVSILKEETWEKLKGACDRGKVAINYCWAKPLPQMTALLQEKDCEEGCAIMDFGAQTTTLSIYGNNYCQSVKVVPLGSDLITQDLQSLKISYDTADKLKKRFGCASPRYIKQEQMLKMSSTDANNPVITLSTTLIAQCIKARLDEMVAPLVAEIEKVKEGIGHIYLTGGGAMLQGLIPYLQEKTGLPTDIGSHADWLDESTENEYYKPMYATLIGTIVLGADYQKEHTKPMTNPPFRTKVEDMLKNIFTLE